MKKICKLQKLIIMFSLLIKFFLQLLRTVKIQSKVQETEFPAGVLEGQSPSNFPRAIRFPDPLKIMQRERIPTAPESIPRQYVLAFPR
jgi:hypothetical protein